MDKIKSACKVMLCMVLVLLVAWAVIHRRVIKAWIMGEPLPEAPEWHKKCFKCLKCFEN